MPQSRSVNGDVNKTEEAADIGRFFFVGWVIGAAHIFLRLISPLFVYAKIPPLGATLAVSAALIIAGIAFCLLLRTLGGLGRRATLLIPMIIAGFAFRLIYFGSTPILEDDWRRYLWDGAVIARGVDPYAHAPAAANAVSIDGSLRPPSSDPALSALRALGEEHWTHLSTVSYPYLTTIYPPVAQAAFFAAHVLKPFSLDALRLIYLVVDAAALAFLLLGLRAAGRAPIYAAAYWWCPLTTFTAFNTAHMDVLLAPFLAALLFFTQKKWAAASGAALAGAAAVKIWPLVLAPLVFYRLRGNWPAMIAAIALSAAAAAALCYPMLAYIGDGQSGLAAYAQQWRRFSFLFSLLAGALGADGDFYARLAVAGTVGAMAVSLGCFRRVERGAAPAAMIAVTAALVWLSPTGYPWYAAWLVIFLPFAPSSVVGALTVGLSVYYLRFPLGALGLDAVTDYLLAPAAFGVPLALFAIRRLRQADFSPLLRPKLNSPRTIRAESD